MTSNLKPRKSAAGRPSILSREDILTAALELGLDNFTMNVLAQKLDTGVSSIYYYFENRRALIRAAAVYSFSKMPYPTDDGQDWSRLVYEYVTSMRDNLILNSSFIHEQSLSELGFDVHFRLLEPFLEAMHHRGFDEKDSMRLMNSLGMAAFASAIETIRQNEFLKNQDSMKKAARRQFERHDPGQFPRLEVSLDIFTLSPTEKLESLLRPILEKFASDNSRDPSEVTALFSEDRASNA